MFFVYVDSGFSISEEDAQTETEAIAEAKKRLRAALDADQIEWLVEEE